MTRATWSRILLQSQIRQVRNDVMHFYPDGIPDESVGHLRNLIQLLDWLRLGAGARLG